MAFFFKTRAEREQIERDQVYFACSFFKDNGIEFFWDDNGKCWDVATHLGWITATNGTELCRIVTKIKSDRGLQ